MAYVFGVARHEAARYVRNTENRPQTIDVAAVEDRSRARRQSDDTAEEIAAALRQLSDVQREVVELKIFGQLTLAEVAATTGTATGTVATRYRTALIRMREWFMQREVASECSNRPRESDERS